MSWGVATMDTTDSEMSPLEHDRGSDAADDVAAPSTGTAETEEPSDVPSPSLEQIRSEPEAEELEVEELEAEELEADELEADEPCVPMLPANFDIHIDSNDAENTDATRHMQGKVSDRRSLQDVGSRGNIARPRPLMERIQPRPQLTLARFMEEKENIVCPMYMRLRAEQASRLVLSPRVSRPAVQRLGNKVNIRTLR